MSDWIKTKAGLQMAETVIRYLPRITVCLEEIAKQKGTLQIVNKAIENLSDMTKSLSKQATVLNNDLLKLIDMEERK